MEVSVRVVPADGEELADDCRGRTTSGACSSSLGLDAELDGKAYVSVCGTSKEQWRCLHVKAACSGLLATLCVFGWSRCGVVFVGWK
eukprot:5539379-Amphidinium_carterae.1